MSPASKAYHEVSVTVVEAKQTARSVLLLGRRGKSGRTVPQPYPVGIGPGETLTGLDSWLIAGRPVEAIAAGGAVKVTVSFTLAVVYRVAAAAGIDYRLLTLPQKKEITVPLRLNPDIAVLPPFVRVWNWKCALRQLPENRVGIALTADIKVILGRPAGIFLPLAPGRCLDGESGVGPEGESDRLPAEILTAVAAAFRAAVAGRTGREEAAAKEMTAGEGRYGVMQNRRPGPGVRGNADEFKSFVQNSTIQKLEEELKSYVQEVSFLREQITSLRERMAGLREDIVALREEKEEAVRLLAAKERECEEMKQAAAVGMARPEEPDGAAEPAGGTAEPAVRTAAEKSFFTRLRDMVGGR
ncbi:MAG: hypothetical protein ACOX8W_02620 [bacterium]